MGAVRLALRATIALFCILLIICIMSVTWALGARRATRAVMQAAFRVNAFLWGIRVCTVGSLARMRPLILVSNHFSYLDLFVLGGRIPAAFTPKTDVRSWPVIGFMSKVAGCVFIDRRASRTLENKHILEEALAAGDILSLFPEGTTNDGTGVLPFRSSFFSLATESGTYVQPLSVVYTHLNGQPVTPKDYPIIGWYGESEFFPHLMQYLRQKGVEAVLLFHAPINPADFSSRKELALHCRSVIEAGIAQVYAGGDKKTPPGEPGGVKPNNGG